MNEDGWAWPEAILEKSTHDAAPKMADVVRAQNFFKSNRWKPILQATVE